MNKEIRDYKENVFFGLSLRQCIFSVCAAAIAVGLYFLLQPSLGTEAVSWICIVGAAPFATLGFITYNGMTAEELLKAYLVSEILTPGALLFGQSNLYYKILEKSMMKRRREDMKKHGIQNTEMAEENA